MSFSHLNEDGYARMVDVSGKEETERIAVATSVIRMEAATLEAIKAGRVKKGDVLAVAQTAGIMGAKKTSDLVPMCHPLMLTGVDLSFQFDETDPAIIITATVKTTGKTGVEMEALTAVSVAALTIYDMCKSVDRWMIIEQIKLVEKAGGKGGHLIRERDRKVRD
ncbi:MAG: cyclic pyranopterin monophosphate synthase MoaC [Syntrophomonadaceae bacterium]|jgi:cyclic pyranopterin phosphate synthase